MVRRRGVFRLAVLVIWALGVGCPSVGFAQVWAHGISPPRRADWREGLEPMPSRPSSPLPRFSPHNILPEPIRHETIAKDNFSHENLRPSHLENRIIEMDAIVKEKILPEQLPRTIEGPRKLANDPRPTWGTFGSTIFLPAMPLPHTLHHRDKMNEGDMVMPHHRCALGW